MVSGYDLWQWRKQAINSAINNNIPLLELDWLLTEISGLDKLQLRLESFKNQDEIKMQLSLNQLESLWNRRLKEHLPVQYIAGYSNWRNFKLKVSPAVLIPRPETEILIDIVVDITNKNQDLKLGNWADLGTGSGAISLGLADVLPANNAQANIHAVDVSVDALNIAKINAANYNFSDRINFYQGYWWQPLSLLKGQFSGMISNPPYIPSATVLSLQPEVVNHEPHLALDGGIDGLDCIRHLIKISSDYLQNGGVWLIEMMAGQSNIVKALLKSAGTYDNIQIYPDLAGIDRFALAYKKSS
ncbi:peptide chain release factor N(5)-glutamine methyltransferase [Anabaena sp. FACHB-1237]|uniref:peptide chain release factor N(5)-glutamine methyltransferase n=1 Tax=Anabaena sp. FACHB-1237 TaxID=2692769 RepID=UPI0016814D8B|nr:peptide chain release factor N(5)-glutamine methyltransferase [Anabaena sp. FACHB-1237]MBD2138421.1 peptide chain release factor N(5)-glutamine methyltransferase [Anabaena sp. FACHB-1237]